MIETGSLGGQQWLVIIWESEDSVIGAQERENYLMGRNKN